MIDALLETRATLKKALDDLDSKILPHLATWQSKALNGFMPNAMLQLCKESNCTLSEARGKVEAFVKNKS